MTTAASSQAHAIAWLLSNFTESDATIEQTIAVSSDGLLMAASAGLDRAAADRLAAIVSGLCSLSDGGARVMGRGQVSQVIVEMDAGYLFVSAIGGGSVLGVLTSRDADLGAIGYDMTLLVDRVGPALTPEVIAQLRTGLAA